MRALAVGAIAIALVGSSCGRDGSDEPADLSAADLVAALCTAAASAANGDGDAARAGFEDVHAGLHALADDLSGRDRQAAGELLQAKHRVEAEVRGSADDALAAGLRELAQVTARAAAVDPATCD